MGIDKIDPLLAAKTPGLRVRGILGFELWIRVLRRCVLFVAV
jgi:hypothetical protein